MAIIYYIGAIAFFAVAVFASLIGDIGKAYDTITVGLLFLLLGNHEARK